MKKYIISAIIFLIALLLIFIALLFSLDSPVDVAPVSSSFKYNFSDPGKLNESSEMNLSSSPYFWLNSGGQLNILDGVGSTMKGEASRLNRWRTLYSRSNPSDTDQGIHPQNLFRLITRSKWQDFSEEVYFKIQSDQLSKSSNRNESNGVLLLLRYRDSDNLYYAGLRVDGTAVIKKKINGEYIILTNPKYVLDATYDRDNNPNLLPHNKWIGIRANITNISSDSIKIQLFVDESKTGDWKLIAEAIDSSGNGEEIINGSYYAGIRSDFMDVEFDDYYIEAI